MNKKAQMNSLIVIAIGIIIFALIVATGLVVLQGFGDSVVTCSSGIVPITVTNETGWINATGYTVAGSTAYGFSGFVVTRAFNRTSNLEIASGNWTYTLAGVVYNSTAVIDWNNASISYIYTWDDTHTWNTTTQTCLNATGGDAETGVGSAYTTIALNGSYLQNNLVPWIPAIIALGVGLLFIGALMGKKNRY